MPSSRSGMHLRLKTEAEAESRKTRLMEQRRSELNYTRLDDIVLVFVWVGWDSVLQLAFFTTKPAAGQVR